MGRRRKLAARSAQATFSGTDTRSAKSRLDSDPHVRDGDGVWSSVTWSRPIHGDRIGADHDDAAIHGGRPLGHGNSKVAATMLPSIVVGYSFSFIYAAGLTRRYRHSVGTESGE